jgi:hypothetical protein
MNGPPKFNAADPLLSNELPMPARLAPPVIGAIASDASDKPAPSRFFAPEACPAATMLLSAMVPDATPLATPL